jgi:predicted dehydrogenase
LYKVAIIGCGLIGSKRAQSILNLKEKGCGSAEVVFCCDIDRIRAKILSEKTSARFSTDWKEAVGSREPDIVVVSTANKYLAPIAVEAFRNGKHVLCEKPLGRSVGEAYEIVRAAEKARVVLKTGFNHRHHPAIARAKVIVDKGEIGPLYFMRCRYGHGGRHGYEKEWRADKDLCGGGELLDQGVHVVDLFRWFMGDFEEAFGYTPTYFWNMPVEDNGFAFFRTARHQVASMHTSWTQWKNIFSLEVFGESGYLIVDGLGGSYGPETLKIGKRPKALGADGQTMYPGGAPDEEVIVFDGPDASWEAEWQEFVSSIDENRQPLGNGFDGLEANRMLEAVYASARLNRPVKIAEQGG